MVTFTIALILLSWADTVNPTGSTYHVYRAPGACSAASTFAKVTDLPSLSKSLADAPGAGTWCYQVTAVVDGVESEPSAPLTVKTKPAAPTGLTATGAAAATPP